MPRGSLLEIQDGWDRLLESPKATQELAEFAKLWVEPGQDPVLRIKFVVSCAGRFATLKAYIDLQPIPDECALANAGLSVLEKISEGMKEFDSLIGTPTRQLKETTTGPIDSPFEPVGPSATPGELETFLERLNGFQLVVESFRRNRRSPSPPAPRSDPLLNYFIEALAHAWSVGTGSRPGVSRQGPFVRFVTTGWRPLGFETPVKDDELEDWIGARVEYVMRPLRNSRGKKPRPNPVTLIFSFKAPSVDALEHRPSKRSPHGRRHRILDRAD
jgi:hypothetical protein